MEPDTPPAPPRVTTRAEEHLYLHLQRFSFCLDRYRLRFPRPGDPPLADADAEARIRAFSNEIDALDAYLAQQYPEPELPIARLRARFGLDEAAAHLLVAAAAPALDLSLARRIAEFFGRAQPDAGFLVDALAASLADERAFFAALRPTSPLGRWRLLKLGASGEWAPETPTLHCRVVVPERLLDWLRGDVGFDAERFARAASLRRSATGAAASPAIARALFRTVEGRRAPLVVAGPALAGKATAVVAAAAERGLPVLDVDLEMVAESAAPSELLAELGREAMLAGAVLLLRHGDVLSAERAELRRAALALLADGELAAAVTVRGDPPEPLRRLPAAQTVHVELPAEAEQRALWQRALPPEVARAPDLDLDQVVRRYHLTPGDILEAGAQALATAAQRGPAEAVTLDDVAAAVRGRLRHRLGDIAELMTSTLAWDDVVLPEQVMARVQELIATIHHQQTVMSGWGFGRKVTYGRAVSALFSGPPGTGKTMVATLIAKALGLELFRVDLSRVVSKWVGETEKNLGRAFDEAANAQAVLLFDEADALFAKRTDVKSSNDRYANLEVNYLLQRLESFEGIVLLTTNNQSSIDDAFRRRLRFRIEFPTPEPPERELLWRSMFPPGAPLADDVGFEQLASDFEMSGGYIKNAVVRAAFLAAAEGEPAITHDLLVRAARLEWEEMGRLARG